jgi:hypothetical protein
MVHCAWYLYIYADPVGRQILDFEVDEAA